MIKEEGMMMRQKFISSSLVSFNPQSKNPIRLFCFPYAGGGSSVYQPWVSYCEGLFEVIAIQLPGRERRLHETPLEDMDQIVSMLTEEIAPLSTKPFVFLGHSMGAMISYEVAKSLFETNGSTPLQIFVSSCRAPHIPLTKDILHHLPRQEFIKELKGLNGTPESILENDDFIDLILPMLRADFTVAETYQRSMINPLPIPITALIGDQDTVEVNDSLAWEAHTLSSFSHHVFSGDHFYLKSYVKEIVHLIKNKLQFSYINS